MHLFIENTCKHINLPITPEKVFKTVETRVTCEQGHNKKLWGRHQREKYAFLEDQTGLYSEHLLHFIEQKPKLKVMASTLTS